DTVNRAVGSYLAMGGSLKDAQTPAEVIARLKRTTSAADARRTTGLSSSFVDARLGVVLSPDQRGVIWDANRARLMLDGAGTGAVAKFVLDDSLAEVSPVEETRSRTVSFAKESSWIWDYQDRAPTAAPTTTEISVVSEADAGPTSHPAASPAPTFTQLLSPPTFSVPSGTYGISRFDLPVSLTNPNPSGSSKIVYAIDYGDWQDYTSPISVQPGTILSAQTVSTQGDWRDSRKQDQEYRAEPSALTAPRIEPNYPTFGMFYHREVEVSLENPNPAALSRLEYRLPGGDWRPYANPFLLSRTDFNNGANIEARAVPIDSPYYLDSPLASRMIPVDPFGAAGETAGQFSNAEGSARMVTSLDQGTTGGLFAWGEVLPTQDPAYTDQSRLAFTGAQFSEIAPGMSFQIGALSYFNGTIRSGTGADRIDLTIQLDLTINGILFRPDFTFSFDLINTVNTSDAWASADYVRIVDPLASQSLVVNDYEYQFEIEFGRSTSDGFAIFDEFHVLENAAASAEIFGTLVEIGRLPL
ncbi:MAG: choice-of-anchor K domain-containing protein, partial [Verrucomicrobiae bacterium]|nr:choice-of-anchor K domain-containing protein [Verrucomicrobiae bacterium]